MSGQTYLITGANRGIGRGILETLALRPLTTVIAAVRDVPKSTSDLSSVPLGQDSRIILVKIDAASETDALAAAEEIKTKHNITKIDTVIAGAGLMLSVGPTLQASAQE